MPEEAVAAIFEDYVKVTDVGCEALAKNCPSLTNVVSSRCGIVTDVGFAALAMNCASSTTIYLDTCGKVTCAGIEALAQNCPSLKVTDVGIEMRQGERHALRHLHL